MVIRATATGIKVANAANIRTGKISRFMTKSHFKSLLYLLRSHHNAYQIIEFLQTRLPVMHFTGRYITSHLILHFMAK